MSLDLTAVGFETEPYDFAYDWKAAVLYALGIGAKRDELDLVYEGRGPRVFPTFAVVPSYAALTQLLERAGAPMSSVIHSTQAIRLHEPLPPSGTLVTVGTIGGIYDLKRMGQVVFTTRSTHEGKLVCETEWTMLVMGKGGFAGPRPPKPRTAAPPKDQEPDFSIVDRSGTEQALLYRLSGDFNPLHADPDAAREAGFVAGPILHGLCTFGYIGRAVVRGACDGDERRLLALGAQFRKPVWPGEEIRTVGYATEQNKLTLAAYAADRPQPVVTNAWAEIAA
jgi:acyl dehydratase